MTDNIQMIISFPSKCRQTVEDQCKIFSIDWNQIDNFGLTSVMLGYSETQDNFTRLKTGLKKLEIDVTIEFETPCGFLCSSNPFEHYKTANDSPVNNGISGTLSMPADYLEKLKDFNNIQIIMSFPLQNGYIDVSVYASEEDVKLLISKIDNITWKSSTSVIKIM